jgi:hypothetical protein
MLVALDHKLHHSEYVYVDTVASRTYKTFCDYAVDTRAGTKGGFAKSSTCRGA